MKEVLLVWDEDNQVSSNSLRRKEGGKEEERSAFGGIPTTEAVAPGTKICSRETQSLENSSTNKAALSSTTSQKNELTLFSLLPSLALFPRFPFPSPSSDSISFLSPTPTVSNTPSLSPSTLSPKPTLHPRSHPNPIRFDQLLRRSSQLLLDPLHPSPLLQELPLLHHRLVQQQLVRYNHPHHRQQHPSSWLSLLVLQLPPILNPSNLNLNEQANDPSLLLPPPPPPTSHQPTTVNPLEVVLESPTEAKPSLSHLPLPTTTARTTATRLTLPGATTTMMTTRTTISQLS